MKITSTELRKIGRRIKERRTELGMTQPQLAEAVSLSTPSVSKYENGRVAEASYKTLLEFAEALKLPPEALFGEYGSPAQVSADGAAKLVPILGKSAAGAPLFSNEEYDEYVAVDRSEHVDFAVRVQGDSMINARIHDGDLVFAKRQSNVSNGEIAIVALGEAPGETYITTKRFYKYGSTVVLRSENPAYKDIEITAQSGTGVWIAGKVIFLKAYVR